MAVAMVIGTAAQAGPRNATVGNADKISIAVLTPATFNDGGYAEMNMSSLEKAITTVGRNKFETVKGIENVPYTDELTQTAQQLFQQGTDVIIDLNAAGTLFYAACEKVPTGICIEEYGPANTVIPSNALTFAFDEPSLYYLEGIAAGSLTKKGTLGFLSSFKAGFSNANLNAFALGCQAVRPACVVRNVYINSFNDPPKSVEAAKTLLNAGADVLSHDLDDSAGIKAAAASGAWVFGAYKDQRHLVPTRWVTGTNYGPVIEKIFTAQLRAIANGTWKGSQKRLYAAGASPETQLQPWGKNVPKAVKAKVVSTLKRMHAGFNPFCGRIFDTSGKLRVSKGRCLDQQGDFIYGGWNWFVKGVIGG